MTQNAPVKCNLWQCKNILPCGMLSFLLAVSGASCAWAAADPDHFDLTPEQLFNATVMSVSKTEMKLADAPAAVYVLTNQDIIRSGATSIPEALRMVPGVQVARISANTWAISVRGFNTGLANNLLVLMDGREVYDPLFSGVYWDVQDTVLSDIERIEVVRGPGATLWGSNAVNGVVNIITKKAADTQGGKITLTAGTQERAITAARYGGKMDGGAYRVFGKYLDVDREEKARGGDPHDEWRALRGGFRADWETAGNPDSFTLQGDIYRNRDGQIRSTPLLAPPYALVGSDHIHAEGGNLLGRWTRQLSDQSRLSFLTYVDFTDRDQRLIADQRQTFNAEVQYDMPNMGRHDVIAGGQVRISHDELSPTITTTFRRTERTDEVFSGFLQDRIALMPESWYLTLGSKFEHNNYSGFEMQPSGRLEWHIDDSQMAWGSVSRAVRTPSRLEHDLNLIASVTGTAPLPTALTLRPNPDFDSEELTAYELGYRRQLTPQFAVDLATFYNDYDRVSAYTLLPPEITSTLLVLPFSAMNSTTAETYGFEATSDWRVDPRWRLSAGYTLLKMAVHAPAAGLAFSPEAAERQSPQQQVNFRSQWDISNSVNLDTMLYYVDGLPAYSIADYLRLDLSLGWKIDPSLQFRLVGRNLLDDSHREFLAATSVNATEIQRSVYGQFTWSF